MPDMFLWSYIRVFKISFNWIVHDEVIFNAVIIHVIQSFYIRQVSLGMINTYMYVCEINLANILFANKI